MKSSLDMGIRACQEGRFTQAVAILEATTQTSPGDPNVWLALARAYSGGGLPAKAIAAYQFVLNTRPPDDVAEAAHRELGMLDHSSKSAIEDAMRPVCGACGAVLPAARAARPWCLCGWNTRTPPVIGRQAFLVDFMAYAAHRGVSVAFKRREDVFIVARNEVLLQGMGAKTYPVNPRLALGVRNRMAILTQDELRPVSADGGPDALFRVRGLGDRQGGRFLSWRRMVAHLSEIEGVDVSMRHPDSSLSAVLVSSGRIPPGAPLDIRKGKTPEESVGQALVRLGYVTLPELIEGVLGKIGPLPIRPHGERIGELLVAMGVLERRQVKQALFLQSQIKRPLGELIVEARLAQIGDIEDALARQSPTPDVLPPADDFGEMLVAAKLLSRTQLQALAGEQARAGEVDMGEYLRNRHVVPLDQLERAASWRRRKQELIRRGAVRIGEVLITQRAITSEALGQTLMAQIDDPRPLGELLVAASRITPEQLVSALEDQERRRNRLAWEEDDTKGTAALVSPASGLIAAARATTRALTRVLVGDEADAKPVPVKKKGRKWRRKTPWRLAAGSVVAAFLLAIGAGLVAGRASGHKAPHDVSGHP